MAVSTSDESRSDLIFVLPRRRSPVRTRCSAPASLKARVFREPGRFSSLQLCVDVFGQDHLGSCLIPHAEFRAAPAKLRLEFVTEQDGRGPLGANDDGRPRSFDVAAEIALFERSQGRVTCAPGVLHPPRLGARLTSLHRKPPSPPGPAAIRPFGVRIYFVSTRCAGSPAVRSDFSFFGDEVFYAGWNDDGE